MNIWSFFFTFVSPTHLVLALFFCYGRLSYPNNVSILPLVLVFSQLGELLPLGMELWVFRNFKIKPNHLDEPTDSALCLSAVRIRMAIWHCMIQDSKRCLIKVVLAFSYKVKVGTSYIHTHTSGVCGIFAHSVEPSFATCACNLRSR